MSADVTSEPPRGTCVIRVAHRSDTGKVRAENQDCSAVATPSEDCALLVVADGMGGHRGGATAARMAVEGILERLEDLDEEDSAVALRNAFAEVNAEILRVSEQEPDVRGMGTTCSALVLRRGRGWIAHVGDSRVYRIRDHQIEQLTEDHSLVASMVREGLLSDEEAEVHPRRNVLQRSVGVVPDVEVQVLAPFETLPGDRFLVCSDGLHGVVRDGEMAREVSGRPVQQAVDALVELALERGAPDNVTLALAAVLPPGGEGEPSGSATAGEPGSRSRGWLGWGILLLAAAVAVIGVAHAIHGQ